MNNLSVADVNRYMVDAPAVTVENQIAGLCLRHTDCRSAVRLCHRGMRQVDTVLLKYTQNIAGTICAVRQTCTAPDVRIAQKFFRILTHIHTHIGNTLSVEQLCHRDRRTKFRTYFHIFRRHKYFFIIQIYLDPVTLYRSNF